MAELHKKTVGSAFWAGEVEAERREGDTSFKFKCVDDRDRFMAEVDKQIAATTYAHSTCSDLCKKRGRCLLSHNNCIHTHFFQKVVEESGPWCSVSFYVKRSLPIMFYVIM